MRSDDEIEIIRNEIKNKIDESKASEWWTDPDGEEYEVEVIDSYSVSFMVIRLLKDKGIL